MPHDTDYQDYNEPGCALEFLVFLSIVIISIIGIVVLSAVWFVV